MSEMSKAARAAMKAKANRMGGKGEPRAKVDSSDWTPPEMLNTDVKTGMRPISRRAFRKGGKVIEKCEGGPAAMRADRKQRKAGGRSLVTDLINRNEKKANEAREGGDKHVGGYKRGGDVEQDKKLIKKALRQHDKNMHGGKSEDIKLKKGGRAHKEGGGLLEALSPVMLAKKLIEGKKSGGRTKKASGGAPPPADSAPEPKYEDWKKLQTGKGPAEGQGDKTSPPGGTMMPKKAKGGGAGESVGSRMQNSPLAAKGLKSYRLKGRYGHIMIGAKDHDDAMREAARSTDNPKRENLEEWDEEANSYRKARKRGGRAKGKTNIVISINAGKPDDQQAMMPKAPTLPPMPPPPIVPPGMGAGPPPGMPPGMPMGMPPMGPGGPPGMPPMPRKSGGRAAYKSFKDMDAGALSGMGRLEKTEIEHGKRVGRLLGGRARSYKDMDAGSLSGMGRIEKTAIQKHKR